MTDLKTCLQMLNSYKSDMRYEACEELRLADTSSESVLLALEKATQDKDGMVAEAAIRAIRADVHQAMYAKLGRTRPKTELEFKLDQLAAMVIVTTPLVEGRPVETYFGIVSAEVVLGTGMLSEFDAGLADLLGVRANSFQGKLKEAKEAALLELKSKAFELGANAVLSTDLDYSVLPHNMLMVVANGTAVKLAENAIS